MRLTEEQLRQWLEECYRIPKVSHMILVCDRSEDFEVFPVKVEAGQNVYEQVDYYKNEYGNVLEVYSMAVPMEQQLNSEIPVFNFD